MLRAMGDPLAKPGPWNSVAEAYDDLFVTRVPALIEDAEAILAPALGPSSSVLDVATGPGVLPTRLSRSAGRVVAIDFAEKMIERLQMRLDRDRLTNVEARVMDALALELPDNTFDAVVSMFGWFMFDERARGLAEMRRVLKDGGRVLVSSWQTPDRNTSLGAALTALREALPDLPRPAGPLPTQVPETVAGELRAAGFRDVETKLVEHEMVVASSDEYWSLHDRAGAPMVLLRQKLGDAAYDAAAEKAKALLRAKLGDGPVTLRLAAIFTTGVR